MDSAAGGGGGGGGGGSGRVNSPSRRVSPTKPRRSASSTDPNQIIRLNVSMEDVSDAYNSELIKAAAAETKAEAAAAGDGDDISSDGDGSSGGGGGGGGVSASQLRVADLCTAVLNTSVDFFA